MGTFDDANVDKDLLSQIFADEGDDAETDALLNEMLSDEKEDTNTSEDDVLKDLLSDDNDTEETSETDTLEENSEEETQDAVPQDTMEETVEVPAVEEDVPEESVAEPEAKEEKDEKAEPAAKPDFASRSDNDPIMREAKEVMDRERNNGTVTTITSGTTIRGGISSDGSLEVMGVITGDVECQGKVSIIGQVSGNVIASEVYVSTQRLEGSLSSEGTVKIGVGTVIIGDIDATSAYIAGAVKGDIDVNGHVEVDSTAIIKGNIKAKSIQVNNGAVVDGYCSLNYAGVNLDDFFDEK